MTKAEIKELDNIELHLMLGNKASAALGLSALFRSAMTKKSKQELLNVALKLDLLNHPDFVM